MEDIVLEGGVPADAVGGMTADVVEGLPRQPLDAEELQAAGIDLVGEARDDLELLVFPEEPVSRWKHQHLRSGVTEDQEFHLSMKRPDYTSAYTLVSCRPEEPSDLFHEERLLLVADRIVEMTCI